MSKANERSSDYNKQMPNNMWLAKRGYVFYLYKSLDDIKRDDEAISHNLERLNNGIALFNRCYDGNYVFRTRRMSEIKEFISEMGVIS